MNKDWIGIIDVEPSQASNAFGIIYITQTKFSDTVMIHGQISNLPNGNYAMEVQPLREHENNCHDTEERFSSNEEPLPDNVYKVNILTSLSYLCYRALYHHLTKSYDRYIVCLFFSDCSWKDSIYETGCLPWKL